MSDVGVDVDPSDPTPPYEQVRRQLAAHIATGTLPAGTRLPPVRQLAADLALATGTVARTYRELESAGLVATRRGGGTTVLAQGPRTTLTQRRARLGELAARFVADARTLQLGDDEAIGAIRAAFGEPSPPDATAARAVTPD